MKSLKVVLALSLGIFASFAAAHHEAVDDSNKFLLWVATSLMVFAIFMSMLYIEV